MLLPGPTIGIAITGATVGVLVIGFCRAPRQHPFPTHGWVGIAALAGAEWLLFRSIAPVPIYYTFPMFQNLKLFEMPAPGYLGFVPFAVECFTMYVTAAWL